MAKFVFQLQGLLRHRELEEQQRQRDLAEVLVEYEVVKAELRRLDDMVGAAVTDLRENRLVGVIDLPFLAAHRRFILATQRQGAVHMQKLSEVQVRVDAARARLIEAAKQKKIVEKLREKQHDEWAAELAMKELAALDEVAMQLSVQHSVQQSGQHSGQLSGQQLPGGDAKVRVESYDSTGEALR